MRLGIGLVASCLALGIGSFSFGHDAFKEPLEKRYDLKTVSCKTCHPVTKDRSIHNRFGRMLEEQLKGKDLTRRFNEAEAAGDEAKAEFEKEMVREFLAALEVVEKEKLTIKEIIEAGLMNGTRLNKEED